VDEYELTTIGWLGDATPEAAPVAAGTTTASDPAQAAADQVFSGCTNRTEIAAFIAAMAFERYTKGIVIGLGIGALVGAGALYYFSNYYGGAESRALTKR
jgi:hypothetical protein